MPVIRALGGGGERRGNDLRDDDKRPSITMGHVRSPSCKTDIGAAINGGLAIKPRFYRSDVVWEPPDASRIRLVPEELHDVHRSRADAPVNNGFPN